HGAAESRQPSCQGDALQLVSQARCLEPPDYAISSSGATGTTSASRRKDCGLPVTACTSRGLFSAPIDSLDRVSASALRIARPHLARKQKNFGEARWFAAPH